jgi:hypothetical protein
MRQLNPHAIKINKLFLSYIFCISLFTWQISLPSCSSKSNDQLDTTTLNNTKLERDIVKPLTSEEKLHNLEIEYAFWKNRLVLARNESLNLITDLVDSVMILEIRGVPLRICKIHDFYINNALSDLKLNQDAIKWLSQPFELEDDWSNIPKEPIKIREINTTDSTTESVIDFYKEDLPDIQVAFFFSRDLSIYIDHSNDQYPSDSSLLELMNKKLDKKVKYLVKLKLSALDAKAIYRGLSVKSELSFRY